MFYFLLRGLNINRCFVGGTVPLQYYVKRVAAVCSVAGVCVILTAFYRRQRRRGLISGKGLPTRR